MARSTLAAAALAAVAALALAPAYAGADHRDVLQVSAGDGEHYVSWAGATPDGSRAYFTTAEQLDAADTDADVDVYERRAGALALVSVSEQADAGGVGFHAVSADGSRVVLSTQAQMTDEDTDSSTDLYLRAGGDTRLITRPEEPPLFSGITFYAGMSDDGERIFFFSTDPFVGDDQDFAVDLYVYEAGTITLLSPGTESDAGPNLRVSASADGSRAVFVTNDALDPGDTDSSADIYLREGDTTTLVTSLSSAQPAPVLLHALARAGDRVIFETDEPLLGGDDGQPDLYAWSEDGIELLTPDTPGDVDFQDASADATVVLFTTYDRIDAADTDDFSDLYRREGDVTTLETTGPAGGNAGPDDLVFGGANADSSRLYFATKEPLTADDGDAAGDVYERADGVTRRVSVGATEDDGAWDNSFAGATPDGSRILWQSDGPLTSDDTDAADDLYERMDGVTRLVTGGSVDVAPIYAGHSTDLRHVFFTSAERLTASDGDDFADLFESRLDVAPTLTATAEPLELAAGAPAAAVDPALALSDPDTATLTGATVKLTGEGTLGFAGAAGIAAVLDGDLLTLTGDAAPEQYEAALRSITYAPSASPGDRAVAFSVTDGVESATASRAVRVVPPPEGPAAPPAPPAPVPAGGAGKPFSVDVVRVGANLRITLSDARPASLRLRTKAGGTCRSWSPRLGRFRTARCHAGGLFFRVGNGPSITRPLPRGLAPGRYSVAVRAGGRIARTAFRVR